MDLKRPLLALSTAFGALFLTACQSKDVAPEPEPEPQPKVVAPLPLADLVGADFASLSGDEREGALRGIAAASGDDYRPDPKWMPIEVRPLGDHFMIIAALSERPGTLAIRNITPDGLAWTRVLELGAGASYGFATLGKRSGFDLPLLVLSTEGLAQDAAQRFYIGLAKDRGVLLRVIDGDKGLANGRLSSDHPDLAIDAGDIGSNDPALQLAATVALSQASQTGERGNARVRSHLNALAGGTDPWLAEAAAEVLSLPVE